MLRGGVEAKHLLPVTEAAVGVGATKPVHHHHGDGRWFPLFPPPLSIPSAPKLTPSRLPTSSTYSRCTRCGCPPASSLPSDLSSFLGPTHLIPLIPFFWKTYVLPKEAPTCAPASLLQAAPEAAPRPYAATAPTGRAGRAAGSP